jgi:hypothetical protein
MFNVIGRCFELMRPLWIFITGVTFVYSVGIFLLEDAQTSHGCFWTPTVLDSYFMPYVDWYALVSGSILLIYGVVKLAIWLSHLLDSKKLNLIK